MKSMGAEKPDLLPGLSYQVLTRQNLVKFKSTLYGLMLVTSILQLY